MKDVISKEFLNGFQDATLDINNFDLEFAEILIEGFSSQNDYTFGYMEATRRMEDRLKKPEKINNETVGKDFEYVLSR